VERAGLRLSLLAQQAAAGDIVLLFADESECLTHPYLAYVWARRGEDLRVAAPGQAQRRALLGALDAARRELVVVTSARQRSADFLLLLERLDQLYGPAPGRLERPVVLVLDNGPIHTSQATSKALAARPWLTVEWLPKYAPELNAIEHRWRDLKRHFLAHRTFASADQLDTAIHQAVHDLNRERRAQTCSVLAKAA
jgi:transposase